MSVQKTKETTQGAGLKTVTSSQLGIGEIGNPVSAQGFAVWVRRLLQGWRQGTVGVKGRSDVKLSGKKPWKQKGTGRARAGTARSPLWRGGGVIFGPQPRTRTLKITKKMKEGVLRTLLADYLNAGNIIVADWQIKADNPSTREASNFLKSAQLDDKKITLFVTFDDKKTALSFINLPNVQILHFDQPNAFDLAVSNTWLVLDKDFESFKEMVSQWL